MSAPAVRRQRNPARDARLTRAFHRALRRLQPPPRPADGVRLEITGWVRIDVELLKERGVEPPYAPGGPPWQ